MFISLNKVGLPFNAQEQPISVPHTMLIRLKIYELRTWLRCLGLDDELGSHYSEELEEAINRWLTSPDLVYLLDSGNCQHVRCTNGFAMEHIFMPSGMITWNVHKMVNIFEYCKQHKLSPAYIRWS